MNFITEELYRFIFVTTQYKRSWIAPICFFFFCLVIKIWMVDHYNNYLEMHGSDIFAPLITQIAEKHFYKIDKIAFWGSIIIFLTAYLKYRKRYF